MLFHLVFFLNHPHAQYVLKSFKWTHSPSASLSLRNFLSERSLPPQLFQRVFSAGSHLPLHCCPFIQQFSLSTHTVVLSAGYEDLGEITNQSYWVPRINQAASSRTQTLTQVICLKSLSYLDFPQENVGHSLGNAVPC